MQTNDKTINELNLLSKYFEEAQIILSKINGELGRLGLSPLPNNNIQKELEQLSVNDLKELLNLRTLAIELDMIHVRMKMSIENKQIHELVEEIIPKLISKIESIKERITIGFKKSFKETLHKLSHKASRILSTNKVSNPQDFEKQYFKYSDFAPFLDEILDDRNKVQNFIVFESDIKESIDTIFIEIKHKVMFQKSHLKDLVTSKDSVLDVESLKDTDFLAYEYLRSEAFRKIVLDTFGIEVFHDKTYYQEIIRPSDKLSKKLKLQTSEMAIFAIALDTIRDFGIKKGQRMQSNLLNFVVVSSQKQTHVVHNTKISIGENKYIYLAVPIYLSFLKAELESNQQHKSVID